MDRNNKATLPFTGPGRTSKSSAKDLSPHEVKLQSASQSPALRAEANADLLRFEAGAYSYTTTTRGANRPFPARILT